MNEVPRLPPDLAVVILTYNEEANLAQALASVCGWAREVFVLDSHSTDATEAVAAGFACRFFQNRFVDYASQRNHAIQQLPIESAWILFLDADEWLPGPLKAEIAAKLAGGPPEDGFYIKRRFIWMGRWIKRGYYPTWILRLFRRGKGACEAREVNEHLVVAGPVGYLAEDFMHEDRKGLNDWVAKHNAYATREARLLLAGEGRAGEIQADFRGGQAERKRWLRYRVWNRLPPLLRPFLYFAYRYLFRGGFTEGAAAFSYHFMQALWFHLLVDLKYLELKAKREVAMAEAESTPADAVAWHGRIAARFDARYREGKRFRERFRVWQTLIAAHCPRGGLALDLGCGSGVFTAPLAERAGWVRAVDGSADMLDIAQATLAGRGLSNVQWIESRLEDFMASPLPEADLALCSSVVEYLDGPTGFLADCRDALKPGGVLLLSAPNGASWYRRLEARLFALTGHPRYYRYVRTVDSPETWMERLRETGFDILEHRYFGAAPVLSPLLRGLGLARHSDTMVLFAARAARHPDIL